MNITIIGTGYVGLVTAACFAETGNHVVGADIDEQKIRTLTSGKVPIFEPGLEEMLRRNHGAGRLEFTSDVGKAIEAAEIVFIAVGTPQDEDGSADLRHVLAVAETIGKRMARAIVVVNKSPAPGGT